MHCYFLYYGFLRTPRGTFVYRDICLLTISPSIAIDLEYKRGEQGRQVSAISAPI